MMQCLSHLLYSSPCTYGKPNATDEEVIAASHMAHLHEAVVQCNWKVSLRFVLDIPRVLC
jgi:ABC-type transport system involved in Fe-S cluster assembly fused permease/ATPase subunit